MSRFSFNFLVIDCGSPGNILGANFIVPTNTRYNQAFTFSCSNGYKVEGNSTNGATKTEVKCGADGQWDLGSLQCVGRYKSYDKSFTPNSLHDDSFTPNYILDESFTPNSLYWMTVLHPTLYWTSVLHLTPYTGRKFYI